ncbi:PPE family protein [Mycobacterium kansasii]|uniref:PPE family protein n=1 Tax=Mycobacterium kansasii TaxID=1768 RepID=A0A1V3XCW9_MYCKA|nr:PPE family protein [Mycobacterium kansasii]
MAAAAAPYMGWLTAAAVQAGGLPAGRAMVSAFEAAQAATVQPIMVALNRNAFVRMVLTNWFGQNCLAIAGAEAEYEQMWAQDVAAMAGYHGCASAVAARLTPFQRMLQSLPGQVSASAPAAAPAGPDIALSMFGTTLFQSGTAHATSGFGALRLPSAPTATPPPTPPCSPGLRFLCHRHRQQQHCRGQRHPVHGNRVGQLQQCHRGFGGWAAPPSSPATILELLPGSAIATSATSPPSPVTTARLLPGPAAATRP